MSSSPSKQTRVSAQIRRLLDRAEAAESRVADLEAGIREVAGTLDADYDVKDDRGRRDAINYYARAVAGRLRALVDDEETR